jgi:hypothetical protein
VTFVRGKSAFDAAVKTAEARMVLSGRAVCRTQPACPAREPGMGGGLRAEKTSEPLVPVPALGLALPGLAKPATDEAFVPATHRRRRKEEPRRRTAAELSCPLERLERLRVPGPSGERLRRRSLGIAAGRARKIKRGTLRDRRGDRAERERGRGVTQCRGPQSPPLTPSSAAGRVIAAAPGPASSR